MVTKKRVLRIAADSALAAVWVFMLFLPLPHKIAADKERYRCVWEDGTETQESYSAAYSALDGVSDEGFIELKRGTHVGRIDVKDEILAAFNDILSEGSLAELLLIDSSCLSRIGRAALYREYGDVVYYSVDAFRYTGRRVLHEDVSHAEKAVLLSGTFPAGYLAKIGARELRLAAEAELSAEDLAGSRIEEISACAPYVALDHALYLDVAGQRRLIAAPPAATELTLSGYDYADEGALLPCTALASLVLPFAGNAARSAGSDFDGTFACLFSGEEGYAVPKSLKKVKIAGGKLVSHCFYACPFLEEADACGLRAKDIAIDAFADMVGWKIVHSPRGDIQLPGRYTAHAAPCGCTVFVRG